MRDYKNIAIAVLLVVAVALGGWLIFERQQRGQLEARVAEAEEALAKMVAVEKAESTIIGYVENMSGYYCAETGKLRPLFPSGDLSLNYPLLGRVPFDPELARNCDRGRTIEDMPDTPVARAIFEIGREILKILKISSQEGTEIREEE